MADEAPDTAEGIDVVVRLHTNGTSNFKCPHCQHGLAISLSSHGFIYDDEVLEDNAQ